MASQTCNPAGLLERSTRRHTEFERGHALELFQFRIDDAGMRMSSYSYRAGKQLWCPTLEFSGTQCSIEDAPAPAGGRAA